MQDPRKMQPQNPYPRGQGTASVPVLFTLRNVQPSIVAGASDRTAVVANASVAGQAGTAKTKTENATAVSVADERSIPKNKIGETPAAKKSAFSLYNIVVFGLAATVAALAYQNSRNGRQHNDPVASTATSTSDLMNGLNTTSTIAPTDSNSSNVIVPDTVATTPPTSFVPSTPNLSLPNLQGTGGEASVPKLAMNPTADLNASAKPPTLAPLLLPTPKNNEAPTSDSTNAFPGAYAPADTKEPALPSGPYGTVGQGTSSQQLGMDSSQVSSNLQPSNTVVSNDGNTPNILDTETPDLTNLPTRALYQMLQNQNRQVSTRTSVTNSPAPGSPSLSNMDTSGQMLSGSPYPPIARTNQPIPLQPNNPNMQGIPATSTRSYVPQGAAALADMNPSSYAYPANTNGNRYIQQPPSTYQRTEINAMTGYENSYPIAQDPNGRTNSAYTPLRPEIPNPGNYIPTNPTSLPAQPTQPGTWR